MTDNVTGSPKRTSHCGIFCTSRENPVVLLITECQSLQTHGLSSSLAALSLASLLHPHQVR